MLKYIVSNLNGVYHLCYQIPGTSTYHSFQTFYSERLALEQASERNKQTGHLECDPDTKGRRII